jgi:ATP-binding cassette subfamily F protein 3
MLIAANQITKFYGQQDLVRKANFHIHMGEKVGLVGPNGSGKSTFVKILMGVVSPDEGEIHRSRHIRIGYLPQDIMLLKGSRILDQVLEVAEEARYIEQEIESIENELAKAEGEEREDLAARLAHCLERFQFLGGYELQSRAEKILTGLGFMREDFERPVETLSGGWAMRVALARLLMSDPDLMLLDEPTNHLDLESLCWLEDYLVQSSCAILVISHDPRFLNRLVGRVIEIQDGDLVSYSGNFDQYREEKCKRESHVWAAYRTQQEQIRQIERFIERNRVRKDRARQVQSRVRTLEKMERIEPPSKIEDIEFHFPPAPPTGRLVVELEKVTFGFEGRPLFEKASLALHRGDRVAILGPNGSGKSTLLRILAGHESSLNGARRTGHGVKLAYFSQHQMDLLNLEKTVLQEISDAVPHPHQGALRNILGAFQFRGDHVFKPVKVLSGGERSRLLLCKIILAGANLLLLDEPTNHLDIGSREVLEEALKQFQGTLCLVTHDRQLMDVVANHILVMRRGGWELLPGNYADYQRMWMNRAPASHKYPIEREKEPRKDRGRKRREAEWRNKFSRMRAPMRGAISDVEKKVEEATLRIEQIRTEMANPETYRNSEKVQCLQKEHGTWKSMLQAWTKKWDDLTFELESLEQEMKRERPE